MASQGKAKPEVAPAAPPPEVKPHQTGWSWSGLPPGSGPTKIGINGECLTILFVNSFSFNLEKHVT